MDNGRRQLIENLEELTVLARENPCGMPDSLFLSLVQGLRALMSSYLTRDVSREAAARYLNISTRTLQRRVNSGELEPPERHGHKELSFSLAKLVKYKLRKFRENNKNLHS